MGRMIKDVLIEIENYKKVSEKISACLCQEDIEKAVKEQLKYGDLIMIKGLIEYRIHELLEMEVEDGKID